MRYVAARHIVIDDRPTPVPFWKPDQSFTGKTVTIVGGGPSHAAFNLALLAGRRFIAVNSSCRAVRPIATEADPIYFSDNSWNANRPSLAANWPGPVMTCNRNTKARLGDAVRRIDVSALTMLFRVLPDYVQASSGHVAACLAVAMGARRLVLIGFECTAVGGRTHGHSDYDQSGDMPAYPDRFIPGWWGLAPAFDRMGVEVLNATPHSLITCFPTTDIAEALR